ncbi:ABC transporter substrate-binding protein [Paralimibaculum aggregatum]|uniref:ABC transporter substrate-binding protein n=1 Tax=Paralimibaculum aggregatum TaxID=3036245 RepID=A0ABQ6LHG2_9RHOB|nr:ABC transporter substrate-binding protein [Limibaculum sp. NKW23]
MRLTRRLAGLALAAAAAMPFALAPAPASAETPPNMLVIAATIDDIVSLDPQESFEFSGSDILNNMYGSLVSFDPADLSKGYVPDIAESWEISGDGKVYTFKIRDGLKFHSGNPVTAKDVEFSLRRAVAMKKTPSFILTQFGFTEDNMGETLVAVDDSTFQLTTDKKYATSFVLNCLTATIAYIVDSETVKANEQDGDWGNTWLKTNSAGSGAYKLVNWKPNEAYTLEANADYWRGAPAMQRVIVRHIPESATQRLLLERGDVDIARNLNPEDIAAVEGAEGIAVDSDLRGRIMYFSMNQKHPILSKPKVREALKYLADYEGMANSFLRGQYTVHQAFLPLTYMGELKDQPYSLNVEKAKALLAEAGHADGFEVEIIVRTAQERVEIAQTLQQNFAKAGITATISQATGKQTLAKYRSREFDIYVGAWGPDYPDPHTNADTFSHNPDNSDEAGLTGKLAWRNGWDIPEMTAMTEAALVEGDREVRAQMYVDIQKEWQRTAPFVPMFQKIEQIARRDSVSGFVTGSAITAAFYWSVTK